VPRSVGETTVRGPTKEDGPGIEESNGSRVSLLARCQIHGVGTKQATTTARFFDIIRREQAPSG